MEANEYQIGGNHYKIEYQHWDFVSDNNLHYLLGTATKYASRWREKNGIEDLRKALHYVAKAEEVGLKRTTLNTKSLNKFCAQFCTEDAGIIQAIAEGELIEATIKLNNLIEQELTQPTKNYIDPDNNYIRG